MSGKAKLKESNCQDCESSRLSIFCGLDAEAQKIIDESKIENTYKRGQYIFYEGNSPGGIYCINSGVIKVETESSSGKGHILRVVHGGDILGYRSLFSGENYSASALVQEDAHVCYLPKLAVEKLIHMRPEIALRFLRRISKELFAAESRLCAQSDKSAASRIAEALLYLKGGFKEHTWTRKEIADWAGTTPETVMRTLANFESDGLIEQKGRQIFLKDRNALNIHAETTI